MPFHRLPKTAAVLIVLLMLFSPSGGNPDALAQTQGGPVYLPLVMTPPVFQEGFSGDPAAPQPWRSPIWEVVVHSRDISTWNTLERMQAEHGDDCSPPPASHPVTAYEDAVFLCRNHLMTAINASGYGAVVLTPQYMIDFTSQEAVIRFDMSTLRKSGRDWVDLWITPYEDNLQIPVHDWIPDLNGEPRRAVVISMGFDKASSSFTAGVVRNFELEPVPGTDWIGYERFLTPSAMRRDTFELRIRRNHIRFGMPDYNFWWVDTSIPSLDWSQGVVQFGHHSYTPGKSCSGCGPNTWHWDNVYMAPVVPFEIDQAAQRYTDAQTGGRAALPSPAPANARLRFSGIGSSLQVSFDDGRTWVNAAAQAQEKQLAESFKTYWMPIPEGTASVRFRGQNWWGGSWRVKDISVWSR